MSLRFVFGLAAGLAGLTASPALAFDVTASPLTVKAGSTARLYGVFDCFHGGAPAASARVDHGKITTKQETINRCGNRKQPITALYYTPDPGYHGPDEAKIYRGSNYTLRRINVK